eukprot:10977892-Lingulodinium_polyedra.AAC.1
MHRRNRWGRVHLSRGRGHRRAGRSGGPCLHRPTPRPRPTGGKRPRLPDGTWIESSRRRVAGPPPGLARATL